MNRRQSERRVFALLKLGKQSKIVVRVIHHNASPTLQGCVARSGRHHHTACRRCRKFGEIFGMTEKAQVRRCCRIEARKPCNLKLGITQQFDRRSNLNGRNNICKGKAQGNSLLSIEPRSSLHPNEGEQTSNYLLVFKALITLSVMSCFGLT